MRSKIQMFVMLIAIVTLGGANGLSQNVHRLGKHSGSRLPIVLPQDIIGPTCLPSGAGCSIV